MVIIRVRVGQSDRGGRDVRRSCGEIAGNEWEVFISLFGA